MERNIEDGESLQPPDVPPDELEEALKWLEEMTARQRGPAEPADLNLVTPIDSPFSGLIETEEGDLPDWLRETPATADEALGEDEVESRLDWLAKMAQRESIEELPTLQWRHLGDVAEDTALPDGAEALLAALEPAPPVSLEDEYPLPEAASESPPELSLPEEAPPVGETWAEAVEVEEPEQAVEVAPEVELPAIADEALPPMDEVDAAMAWIEELAVSQDAPIEDVPSVADRALASKLMLEAGLTSDILGLERPAADLSLLEELTPINPFVDAEDFADTVVLVETLVIDQEGDEPQPMPDARDVAVPGMVEEFLIVEELAAPEAAERADEATAALSFDQAMAFLDDLAAEQSPPHVADTGPLPELVETADEELVAEKAPWHSEAEALPAIAVGAVLSGDAPPDEAAVTQPLEPTPFLEEPATAELQEAEPAEALPAMDELLPQETDEALPVVAEAPDEAQPAGVEISAGETDEAWPIAAELATDESAALALTDVAAPAATAVFVDAVMEDESMPETPVESLYFAANDAMETTPSALEATLRELDVLALPSGRTLDDVDLTLRRRAGAYPTRRDLPAALLWLEAALGDTAQPARSAVTTIEPDLDETELIARMPEDPDAVLAWLESIAGEGEAMPPQTAPSGSGAPIPEAHTPVLPRAELPVEELGEANLLDMPDDPDEAMAWLEGMARGESATPVAAVPPAVSSDLTETAPTFEAGVETPTATSPQADMSFAEPPSATAPVPGVRVNVRKRRFVIKEGQPAAPHSVSPSPEDAGADWVDQIKRLE